MWPSSRPTTGCLWPPIWLALGIGAVVVPLNPQSPAAELERELTVVRPTVVVAGAGVDLGGAAGPSRVLNGEAVDGLLAADPVPITDRDNSDLAVLMFTPGPAAPQRPPCSPTATCWPTSSRCSATRAQVRRDDVASACCPLFHIFGLNVVLGLTLSAGASVVLVERFDPVGRSTTIRDHGVTLLAGRAADVRGVGALPDAVPTRFASVRLAVERRGRARPRIGGGRSSSASASRCGRATASPRRRRW